MTETTDRRWRLDGWEWGWEDEPCLVIEFEGGEKRTLYIGDIYDDYDDDLACMENPSNYLPKQWFKLMEGACEDCQASLGDMDNDEGWHFYATKSPCRWHPQSELDALYEHAKTHKLFEGAE